MIRFRNMQFKMASHSEKLAALALQNQIIAAVLLQRKQRKRSASVRRSWKTRQQQVHFSNLIAERRLQDPKMHCCYFQMLPVTSDDLLHLTGPSLTKDRSHFREP